MASSPPAEAPIATMGIDDAPGSADIAVGRDPDSDLLSTRESRLSLVRTTLHDRYNLFRLANIPLLRTFARPIATSFLRIPQFHEYPKIIAR
jgi:hypothetical protein